MLVPIDGLVRICNILQDLSPSLRTLTLSRGDNENDAFFRNWHQHRELLSRHAAPVPNVYSRISRRSQALQDSLRACARHSCSPASPFTPSQLLSPVSPTTAPQHPEPSRLLQPTTNSLISRITASFSASHGRRGQPISGVPRRARVYPWAPLCAACLLLRVPCH
ncbi:uncharacterized protein SCHCODRAFT_01256767 [Schizophyllum commune H4-8]|uniref:uncharacterized protein n=1 Tax=Schizophyllum commune (strain H4-8 / FGSC 9210) TaxID=578458 RepID=UPI00215E60EE|nr:uncharacterized protein SCHCODRAFT_01256767 [Schizophyllum commune H4-8]KAI5885541.1 hypothetical protein SCHCODRAFT_01256767 [Schizophyllum commune H4-8]